MAWVMLTAALALFGWFVVAPPQLPPDIDDVSPPQPDAPSEDVEAPAEPPAEAPSEDVETPAEQPEAEAPPEEAAPPEEDAAPVEDEAIAVTPPEPAPDTEPTIDDAGDADASTDGAAVQRPSNTAPVQRPGATAPSSTQSPTPPAPAPAPTPTEGPAEAKAEPAAEQQPEAEQEPETYRKLGGFRLFRIGVAAKIGYTHGTSNKNGLFDRDKSIQDSIDNGMVTTSGAGDLGKTKYGGPQFGFILDAEVVGINVWFDFHKFFNPGGMWAVLLGYDHEFGFGKRLRLDVGAGFGLHKAFLGSVLSGLYYDQNNPAAVNIGTLGIEGRGMVDLHIKIVGPLFTGPSAMLGYHYLWSANAAEVTAEKGLHYSFAWALRLDFAAPKLIGGKKKKKS